MKRTLAAVAVAASALALTACQPAAPVAGTVVEKDFDRGHCKTTYKTGKPKSTKCTMDDYELDVRTADGKIREVDVSSREYDQYRVGDRYPR